MNPVVLWDVSPEGAGKPCELVMSSESQSRYALDNINVMVVDDSRHMRSLIQSILHALGVKNVCEAGDAAEAFNELKHFHADVIITDWHMEPLDGVEFARLVRTAKDTANPYVPIIMLTGYSEQMHVCEARDAGINEFLTKPISAKALYARLISIIDNPRPFVRTTGYFGPDRRRQKLGSPRGKGERRKDEIAKPEEENAAEGLSPDEVEALLK